MIFKIKLKENFYIFKLKIFIILNKKIKKYFLSFQFNHAEQHETIQLFGHIGRLLMMGNSPLKNLINTINTLKRID